MSVHNIHSARAELNLVEILDEFGASWWITAARYDQIIASGVTTLTRQFAIVRPGPQDRAWLQLADAARQLRQFVGGLTEDDAKMRVWRARKSGKFVASGQGRALRIEPASFDSWCMQQQQAYLDAQD